MKCLRALQRQTYPASEVEIIVVNDGGPLDESVLVPGPIPVRVLHQVNSGPAVARNNGAGIAEGCWLLFTDDDCVPEPGWIEAFSHALTQHPAAIWGGHVYCNEQETAYSRTAQTICGMVYAYFNHDPTRCRFFTSNNFALSRELYRELGGFSAAFCQAGSEDRDLCDRAVHAGGRLRYCPQARTLHEPRLTLVSFARMFFRYGRGAYLYHERRHQRGSGSISQDVSFHLRLPGFLRDALRELPRLEWASFLALTLVWQVMNTAVFFYELLQHKLGNAEPRADQAAAMVDREIHHR